MIRWVLQLGFSVRFSIFGFYKLTRIKIMFMVEITTTPYYDHWIMNWRRGPSHSHQTQNPNQSISAGFNFMGQWFLKFHRNLILRKIFFLQTAIHLPNSIVNFIYKSFLLDITVKILWKEISYFVEKFVILMFWCFYCTSWMVNKPEYIQEDMLDLDALSGRYLF